MAEKNTRSILESIKNKLSKIDQKSDANSADSDIASEFEYVATHAKPQTAQNNNPEPVVNDKPEIINQTPAPEKVAENDINSSAEFGEEDIEDYEHQIDFAAKPKEEIVDDLDMNAPLKNDFADELSLNAIAETPDESAPKLDEELTFDDEEEEPAVADETSAALPEIEEFNLPEINEENDFLNEKNPQPIAEENPQPLQEETAADDLEEEHIEPLDEELELEEDEEDLEDEDLDEEDEDLDNEDEEEENDDLEDHEDSLEEEHEEIADDLQHPHDDQIKNAENVNAKEPDQYEAELEQLEHELEEQAKKQHAQPAPIEESGSQAHDIELELENDMKNFNSQTPDLNKFSAPVSFKQNTNPLENKAPDVQKTASQILSEKTIEQSRDTINQLFQAKEILPEINNFNDAKLREIAIEILTPKLDKWLNNNLPKVVEEIVRHEIKKIIPK